MKYDKYRITRFCWMHLEESATKVVNMVHSARDYVLGGRLHVEQGLVKQDRYYIERRGVHPQDFEIIRAFIAGISLALGVKIER